MSQIVSGHTKVPKLSKGAAWNTWQRQFKTFLKTETKFWVWDAKSKPQLPAKFCAIKKKSTFVERVSGTPMTRELGLQDTFVASDVTDELVAEYNASQRADREEAKKKITTDIAKWAKDVEVVSGYLEQAVEQCETTRKIIECAGSSFHDQLAALQKVFAADDKQDDLTSNIMALIFLRFRPGTASEHSVRYKNVVDKLVAPRTDGGCGGTISIVELAKILWSNTLQDFSVFADYLKMFNSRSSNDQNSESLQDVMDEFVRAHKWQGKINVDKREREAAVRRQAQDAQDANAEKSQNRQNQRNQNRNTRRAGASAADEAFAADGPGRYHQPDKPSGNCAICWQDGHYARECTGVPHEKSTHPKAVEYHASKASLFKGRPLKKEALAAEVSDPANEKIKSFAMANPEAFLTFCCEAGSKKKRTKKRPVPDSEYGVDHSFVVDVVEAFPAEEDTARRRAARPLTVRRRQTDRSTRLGVEIQMQTDSAASAHMAPADEVQQLLVNKRDAAGSKVLTADASDDASLEVTARGDLAVLAKSEQGRNKECLIQDVLAVDGLRRWLFAVPQAVHEGHQVHYAPESDGGSWLQFKNSEERLKIDLVGNKFMLQFKHTKQRIMSLQQRRDLNHTSLRQACHFGHRILSETKRRGLVKNLDYFPDVEPGQDVVDLFMKGQRAGVPATEERFRPKQVGAYVCADFKGPIPVVGINGEKYVATIFCKASKFRQRYHVKSVGGAHLLVEKFRQCLAQRGYAMQHFHGDGGFNTQGVHALAAKLPNTFTLSFSPPETQAMNPAEADVKKWQRGVRCILKDIRTKDPQTIVNDSYWPVASRCLTDYENQVFHSGAPEMTAYERVLHVQPDASLWQFPLAKVWFQIYPSVKFGPLANRRAIGIFAGFSTLIHGYRIYNPPTKRYLVRRIEDCVFREPSEVYDYQMAVLEYRENPPDAEHVQDIPVYSELADAQGDDDTDDMFGLDHAIASDSDSGEQNNHTTDSSSEEESSSDEEDSSSNDEQLSSDDEQSDSDSSDGSSSSDDAWPNKNNGSSEGSGYDDISEDESQPRRSSRIAAALLVDPKKPKAHWSTMHKYSDDINPPPQPTAKPSTWRLAQTGEEVLVKQHFKVSEMTEELSQTQVLNNFKRDFAFNVDLGAVPIEDIKSWNRAMKSEHKQKFLDADEVERKRCKDFGAYRRVLRSKIQKSGKPINHLLRVLRVKPTEVRVRWAYDQKRAREIDDYETYASVLREETSRLMDIRACHKGYKTLHGDWVSAFLHCDSTEPFHTDYPSGDPEAEDGKYCMEWVKWLYGKAPASKALRDDARDMLLSLGFVEQENSDPCVYIHEERDLQFGLYVDDQKINGPDDQLQWLAHRVSERFESKWLGLTDIDHDFATEESQHFVGSRTICDPVNKILTYDQKRLIQQGLKSLESKIVASATHLQMPQT